MIDAKAEFYYARVPDRKYESRDSPGDEKCFPLAGGEPWEEQFEVAPSTAVRVQARYVAIGSVAPAKQGRPSGSGKLGPYRARIIDKVQAKPDITMPALVAWLEAGHGVKADPSTLSKLLCREGFPIKKRCWPWNNNAPMSGKRAVNGGIADSPSCATNPGGWFLSTKQA